MSAKYVFTAAPFTFEELESFLANKPEISLGESVIADTLKCRRYLDDKIARAEAPIYGINTGFGSLCDTSIAPHELEELQENLVMSHACGTGAEVPQHIVGAMLLLKIKSLSQGRSGIQLATLQRLVDFYNAGVFPVVYEQGSLGASGDLAPLAHLSLPLMGKGEVYCRGERMAAEKLEAMFGWKPLKLASKEGLALLNGTQFMGAYGAVAVIGARRLAKLADVLGALSLDGYDGRTEPFDPLIHAARPHKGQIDTAANMRFLLAGSGIASRHKAHVQDPYSFRCIPQVHGASKDAINYASAAVLTEINAVTDNPNIFPDDDKVISGGNFHGQPIAMPLDFMSIALAELGSISERRMYKLISGTRGLPAFLVAKPGLHSGFMIPQYTAASIVSQNKQFAVPSCTDTIDSSNGQEDHVSMGANGAVKCLKVLENVEKIFGIELFNAAQALGFRRPGRSSDILEKILADYRQTVPFVDKDRILHYDIQASTAFIKKMLVPEGLAL